MKRASIVALAWAGCGGDAGPRDVAADSAVVETTFVEETTVFEDAEVIEVGPTCPVVLLAGGSDVYAQGWEAKTIDPYAITYGADHVRLETSSSGGTTSGQALLYLRDAVPIDEPFVVDVTLRVVSVAPHNPSDSAAAFLGAFDPDLIGGFGSPSNRKQMVYLDAARIGWADDSQSADVAVVDDEIHTLSFALDADGTAHVSLDGTEHLTRSGFVANGVIAIGDQSSEPNLDAVIEIYAVERRCE